MRSLSALALLAAAAGVNASPTQTDPQLPKRANSLPEVSASGNAFWADKNRFYIRGIDYQPGGPSKPADPLADPNVCQRDIAEFKKLGINTVRVYIADNSANHDTCMQALADAGIYLIVDVNNPSYSINRNAPKASYNAVYLQSVFATVDAFSKYSNTLAFFSGNEVMNDQPNTTAAAPFVKAVTRDIKSYQVKRKLRRIPVGYSAADVSQNRQQLANYMNCGTDDERSDFFAFNDYSWCNSDFQTSGWDQKVKNFTGYGIPLFLSETGCNKLRPRLWGEFGALMNSEMTSVYSGGLAFEYTEEGDDFGLVTVNGNSVSENVEFSNLASVLSATPAPSGNGGFTSTTNAVSCPTSEQVWQVSGTLLPAIPNEATGYFSTGAGAGPGLNGAGSQDAASTSTGDAQPGSGGGGGSGSDNAAGVLSPVDRAPFVLSGVVFLCTLVGALLL